MSQYTARARAVKRARPQLEVIRQRRRHGTFFTLAGYESFPQNLVNHVQSGSDWLLPVPGVTALLTIILFLS